MASNEVSKERPIRYTNPDAELPTYYVNNVEMGISPWDMRFRVGQIVTADEKELAIKNVATIYMSIEHARIFVQKAQESIAAWDAMNAKKN